MSWDLLNEVLSAAANLASIATALIAFAAAVWFIYRARRRRIALESLLKRVREEDERYTLGGKGERTILFLTAHLAMTESQVLDAAFSSRCVKRWLSNDPKNGRSNAMYFQYDPKGGPAELGDYMNRINEGLKRRELFEHAGAKPLPDDHEKIPR